MGANSSQISVSDIASMPMPAVMSMKLDPKPIMNYMQTRKAKKKIAAKKSINTEVKIID